MTPAARAARPLALLYDRLLLLGMLAALAAILTAAMAMQLVFGELPCPLCLLQRVAMLGCCFGLVRQLEAGETEHGSGIALLFALLLLVISVRQTLLDLFPRPGHSYIGSAVFGIHMEVWSVLIAFALLLTFAVRYTLFGAPRTVQATVSPAFGRIVRFLAHYVVLVAALNLVAVVLQCGTGECHTWGYRLLR